MADVTERHEERAREIATATLREAGVYSKVGTKRIGAHIAAALAEAEEEGARGWQEALGYVSTFTPAVPVSDKPMVFARAIVAQFQKQYADLREELQDWRNSAKAAADESCDLLEKHCTCVGPLRSALAEAERERDELRKHVDPEHGEFIGYSELAVRLGESETKRALAERKLEAHEERWAAAKGACEEIDEGDGRTRYSGPNEYDIAHIENTFPIPQEGQGSDSSRDPLGRTCDKHGGEPFVNHGYYSVCPKCYQGEGQE